MPGRKSKAVELGLQARREALLKKLPRLDGKVTRIHIRRYLQLLSSGLLDGSLSQKEIESLRRIAAMVLESLPDSDYEDLLAEYEALKRELTRAEARAAARSRNAAH